MQVQKPKQGYKKVKSLFGKHEEIPLEWELKTMREIADISAGGTPSRFRKEYWEDGTIPWLSSGEIRNNIISSSVEKITELGLSESAAKLFPKGTVLIAITGQGMTRGRTGLLDIESSTNQSVVGIIPNQNMFNKFLWYYLQNQYWELRSISQGSNQGGLNLKILGDYPITLPSKIDEQQKIASILSNVDSLINQTQKIIDQTIQLKKGLMQKLLTRGIGHIKFKKTEFGEIPINWNLVELKDLVLTYRNGIYKPDKFYGNGYPSIRMFNIVGGRIIKEKAPLLQVDEQELTDYGLLAGDIVINRVNSDYLVGKAGIVTDDLGLATFESKNIRVRLDTKKCIPNFINIFFSTQDYFKQIRSFIKTAVAQVTINQDDLNQIRIKLPSLPEQQKIASILSNVDSQIQKHQDNKKKLETLKKGLMQKLLTGQIRVKT